MVYFAGNDNLKLVSSVGARKGVSADYADFTDYGTGTRDGKEWEQTIVSWNWVATWPRGALARPLGRAPAANCEAISKSIKVPFGQTGTKIFPSEYLAAELLRSGRRKDHARVIALIE